MNRIFKTLLFLSLFFILIACNKNKQVKQIVIYGSSDCYHCTDFMAQLDSAGMTYEFKDFMVNEQQYTKELMEVLERINYRDYVKFPVVDVEGQVFLEANFDEVKEAAYN